MFVIKKQETLIEEIRQFLDAGQGLIKVEAADDHVYSIVKSLKEPSGVQYILTYQKFYEDGILIHAGLSPKYRQISPTDRSCLENI